MSERLTGDEFMPEQYEDMRRDVLDLLASEIISPDEAAERLAALQEGNPTVSAAHDRHVADNL